ncbi:hypothetical protein [Cognatishimia sp.]|uniref:hypothetical protein n=1 Tax=Cognatishimia sp. TaxID=2211648 RepID=UPI003510E6E9
MASEGALVAQFHKKGWLRFSFDADVAAWAAAARVAGLRAAQDAKHAYWWQCQNTWFVGVDALDNAADGSIDGIGLGEGLLAKLRGLFNELPPFHPAQVSIIKEGYPKPREGETEAAFGYRLRRDAAHVDGLRLNRETSARVCDEYHQFILGLPLNPANAAASPMVLWEGSHHIMQPALAQALADHPQDAWPNVDIAQPYKAARREVFDRCTRLELAAKPGEAYVIHRHLLHGVAPWGQGASADPEGRMIAYFRPEMAGGIQSWITF